VERQVERFVAAVAEEIHQLYGGTEDDERLTVVRGHVRAVMAFGLLKLGSMRRQVRERYRIVWR
jgi:hypothetical protein